MSVELRAALRLLREEVFGDRQNPAPVTYLHDPDTGQMFAALMRLDTLGQVYDADLLDPMDHDHREGDEDE